MVDQVVFSRFHVLRRTKVDPISFAHLLHLLVCACKTDDVRVEFSEVFPQHFRCITGRITGYENWTHDVGAIGGFFDLVDDGGHFVEFVGADVGAMRETEVYLETRFALACFAIIHNKTKIAYNSNDILQREVGKGGKKGVITRHPSTYKAIFPLQVLLGEFLAIQILQDKWTSNLGFSDTFTHFRNTFPLQPSLFHPEIDDHSRARNDKQ